MAGSDDLAYSRAQNCDQLVVFCTEKNKETMIFYNGNKRGEIADPQFCEALFQVWLHPETSNSDVRRSLLRK